VSEELVETSFSLSVSEDGVQFFCVREVTNGDL